MKLNLKSFGLNNFIAASICKLLGNIYIYCGANHLFEEMSQYKIAAHIHVFLHFQHEKVKTLQVGFSLRELD